MQFNLDTGIGTYHIKAYEIGQITVNDDIINHSIIITPEQLIDPWRPTHIADLQSIDFEPILQLSPLPDIVLLGTGATLIFPTSDRYEILTKKGKSIEIMNTGAACRTFNVLMSEGRKVAAALIVSKE